MKLRLLFLPLIVASAAYIGVNTLSRPGAPPVIDEVAAQQEEQSWSSELTRLEAQLQARRQRALKQASWLDWEMVALLETERARLTGDYASYVAAGQALDEAFALAPAGAGPFASRARLNMRLHRLSRVEPDLAQMEAAAVVTERDRNHVKGLRADVAFYSGELATAKKLYAEVAEADPSVRSYAAQARLAWKTGEMAAAEVFLDKATARGAEATKGDRAWLKLMRGLMKLDQNKLDEALAYYREGLEIVPGYWLLEEHVAEVYLLTGQIDRARHMYEDLVERTNNPEFMDQLASIWKDRGNVAQFEAWRARARKIHLNRLALVPEAAVGHALDHFLSLEDNPARALELALENHAIRPGGEAKEKLLAAYLRVGKIASAQTTAEQMLEIGWNTADSRALSALAHELAGDHVRAAADNAAAEKLAPGAAERVSWLRDAVL